MIASESVEKVLRLPLRYGADFAELYVERSQRRTLRTVNLEVHEATSGVELGAGLRLFYGTNVVYAYTNDLREEALLELAETLAKLKGEGAVDAVGSGGLDFRRERCSGRHAPGVPLDARDKRYRLERLHELDAGARLEPAVK